MFELIWHRLPGGSAVRTIVFLMLIGGAAALLWFVVFPWLVPLLPLEDF